MTHFIATFTLLQQSGTQPAISLRYASTHSLEFLLPLEGETKKVKHKFRKRTKQQWPLRCGRGVSFSKAWKTGFPSDVLPTYTSFPAKEPEDRMKQSSCLCVEVQSRRLSGREKLHFCLGPPVTNHVLAFQWIMTGFHEPHAMYRTTEVRTQGRLGDSTPKQTEEMNIISEMFISF